MSDAFADKVKKAAEAEYREEVFRTAVEKYKQKLRLRLSLWDRLFPWRLIVVRKEEAE